MTFDGRNIMALDENRLRGFRGRGAAMIFQDPMTSLNPVLTIGQQIGEAIETHFGASKREARRPTIELLRQVGIPYAERRIHDYPHQFSGGMRQRVMIAMALSCKAQSTRLGITGVPVGRAGRVRTNPACPPRASGPARSTPALAPCSRARRTPRSHPAHRPAPAAGPGPSPRHLRAPPSCCHRPI